MKTTSLLMLLLIGVVALFAAAPLVPPITTFRRIDPIILHQPGTWIEEQVFDPQLVTHPTDSSKVRMFASGYAQNTSGVVIYPVSIGYYDAPKTGITDPAQWTPSPSNPVFQKANSGWDRGSVRMGGIVDLGGGSLYMYYTGSTDGTGTVAAQIGLATSTDGGATWTRSASNPILTPSGQGRNDGTALLNPAVWREDATHWYMYYGYFGPGGLGTDTLPSVRLATSSDGVNWTKSPSGDVISRGNPGDGDSQQIEWHSVLKINGTYWMAYEAYNNVTYQIFLAYSTDPGALNWSKWKNNTPTPILPPSASGWDSCNTATPTIYQVLDDWYLFYCAFGPANVRAGPPPCGTYFLSNWDMGVVRMDRLPSVSGVVRYQGAGTRQ